MGWPFSSSSKKTTTITTETTALTQDQRIALEGDVGTVVAPGSAVGGPGTIAAAPESTVYSEVTMTGLGAGDVNVMMDSLFAESQREREALVGLAGSVVGATKAGEKRLTDIVAATKAPGQAALGSLVPIVIVVVVLFFLGGFK